MVTTSLYLQVVEVTEIYLGTAAKRFVDRQIGFHLKKNPEDIDRNDVIKLASWVKVALGLLTEDKAMVDDCEQRILKLVE